jgi:hypothetical protein
VATIQEILSLRNQEQMSLITYREHIWCTWKIDSHGAHIKSLPLILDLTSLVVWYILLRTPSTVVVCSGGRCYLQIE